MESLRYFTLFVCLTATLGEVIDYKVAEKILYDSLQGQHSFGSSEQGSSEKDPVTRFIGFMKDYDRVYTSREDLFTRHQNFIENMEKAEILQRADEGTAEFGITKFSDLGEDELQQITGLDINASDLNFGGAQVDITTGSYFFDRLINSSLHVSYDDDFVDEPEEIDYRKKGAVSPVQQQGRCGSCWAFSSIGVVEAMYALKNGNMTPLSVQELVDCDYNNDGCEGGLMDIAFEFMKRNGVVTEKLYPYQGVRQRCKSDKTQSKAKVKSYKRLQIRDEDAMKTWLAKQGPLSVGINSRGIQFYRSGVLNLATFMCPPSLNHALVIVGYGVEKKKDGSQLPYWIVKNSWGSNWGEQGFFRIKRGLNVCGISQYVLGVTV